MKELCINVNSVIIELKGSVVLHDTDSQHRELPQGTAASMEIAHLSGGLGGHRLTVSEETRSNQI